MWSRVHSYKSTIDMLAYTNMELNPVPMEFRAEYLECLFELG